MIPKISLVSSGLLNPGELTAWNAKRQQQIRRAVADGFRESGADLIAKVRAQAESVFQVRKGNFVKSFRFKVYDKKTDKLPSMMIGSKIPWMGIHEHGGTIQGPLLIPLTQEGRRMGPKRFKRVITELISQHNTFFRNVNGRVILFANNTSGGRFLSPFRKAYRSRAGIAKGQRLARDIALPIAVLVPRVTIRKRLQLESIVRAGLPRMAAAIENRLRV